MVFTVQAKNKYFDIHGQEISLGPETVVSVIYIGDISNIKQPIAKAKAQVGDIWWSYGEWSFPKAMAEEKAKGNGVDEAAKSFFAERDRLRKKPVSMTVIRHGKLVVLRVPPLKEKQDLLGVSLRERVVPKETFQAWELVWSDQQARK